jgi:hypothetical protein
MVLDPLSAHAEGGGGGGSKDASIRGTRRTTASLICQTSGNEMAQSPTYVTTSVMLCREAVLLQREVNSPAQHETFKIFK